MRTASNLTKPQLTLSSTFRVEERAGGSLSPREIGLAFLWGEEYGKNVRRWRASYRSYEKPAQADSLRRGLTVLSIRLIPHTVFWIGS